MTAGTGFPDKKVMAELTAKMLLEVDAVRFMADRPFIFTSGWASPVYTDCRRLISFPRVRATLIDFATATIMREAGFEQFDAVAGGETAGIPFAAWMADRLGLPMLYVRKKPKGFGRNSQIEGHLVEGQRVLLVEDMTSDGRSKVNFCAALRQAGAKVEHALVFFFYDIFPEARKILGDLCVPLHALATWWDVLAVAKAESGGNSRFTAGSVRVVYNGVDDIRALVPDLTEQEIATTDFGTYTKEQFFDDMARVTQNRADPDLVELLVTRSFDTFCWMRDKGVRFIPIYGRQAFKIDGKFKFWGGLTVEAVGGGPGLIKMLTEAATKRGIGIRYATRALRLLYDGVRVEGVRIRHDGAERDLRSRSIVLACGGFESNSEWRTRYLGPGWDLAKVRGTRFNTGDGIRMAMDIGASPCGNWSGCHAVQWEMNAPEFGDLAVGDQFQKHSYPFAILVNANGKRFVDEGADFRNYTYAKYGRVILEQPGQFAWQIFDQKVKHLQRDEYRIRQITKVTGNTLEELAGKLEGVNAAEFVKTIAEWNKAGRQDIPLNPHGKDA